MPDNRYKQGELQFGLADPVKEVLVELLRSRRQPSAWDLLKEIETRVGLKGRWELRAVLDELERDKSITEAWRAYFRFIRESEDLAAALRGTEAPKKEIASTIDSLLRQSRAYRGSKEFQEMVGFMAGFRDYAPYNNMLVRLQNPTCNFYATESDWLKRFERTLKEDARPMLILAPMHPVMLVYDLDQTEGKPLPKELNDFGKFEGEWNTDWLGRTVANAATHDRIRIDFKQLSSTSAGFATVEVGDNAWKMRIVVHDALDEPSRFGTLCHELAHIHLGHLGSDKDHWWPSRTELSRRTMEIEAEATAFIVTSRLGLQSTSVQYVSRYLGNEPIHCSISLDLVAKVASQLEQMARHKLAERRALTARY
jgi:hypothetical protein